MSDDGYAHPEYLISAQSLVGRLGEPGLVILDVTTTIIPASERDFEVVPERALFEAGHIPSARFVDLERDVSAPVPGLLFTLPDVAQFARMMDDLGISADSFVVVYSTRQPGWAARFWLTLRAFGFRNAAVLNGGFDAWKAGGYSVETGPAQTPAPPLKPFAWKDERQGLFVGTAQVMDLIANKSGRLVNALPGEIFRGEGAIVYGRRGHIPGSVNIPTSSFVDTQGLYLKGTAIEALFDDQEVGADDRVVAYCGAGVAASNVAFARLLMGHENTAVYDGSLLEWSQDPERPLAVGADKEGARQS